MREDFEGFVESCLEGCRDEVSLAVEVDDEGG